MSTSRVPLQLCGLAPAPPSCSMARVPTRYRRFTAHTDPAATLWPSALLPAPTLLQGLSPWGQEGFASSGTTLPCVLSPLPRRARPRCRPTFPRPVLPSPRSERLGARCFASRGLHGVRYLRPTRSLPDLSSGLSGGTAPGFRLQSVSSASWCWLFPCWGFHPLGHTAFTGHASTRFLAFSEEDNPARDQGVQYRWTSTGRAHSDEPFGRRAWNRGSCRSGSQVGSISSILGVIESA